MILVKPTQQQSVANSCFGILNLQKSERFFWEKHNRISFKILNVYFSNPHYPSFFIPASFIDFLAKIRFYTCRLFSAPLILGHSKLVITQALF
jgi:hypothetical protein